MNYRMMALALAAALGLAGGAAAQQIQEIGRAHV